MAVKNWATAGVAVIQIGGDLDDDHIPIVVMISIGRDLERSTTIILKRLIIQL
jgi:hypothetical protein